MNKWYSINKERHIVAEKDGLYYKKGDVGGIISEYAQIEEGCWIEQGGSILGKSKLSGNVIVRKNAVVNACNLEGDINVVSGRFYGCNISGRVILKYVEAEHSDIEGDIVISRSEADNNSTVMRSKINGSGLIRGGIISDSVVLGKFMILDSYVTCGSLDGVNSIVNSEVKNKLINGNTNARHCRIQGS